MESPYPDVWSASVNGIVCWGLWRVGPWAQRKGLTCLLGHWETTERNQNKLFHYRLADVYSRGELSQFKLTLYTCFPTLMCPESFQWFSNLQQAGWWLWHYFVVLCNFEEVRHLSVVWTRENSPPNIMGDRWGKLCSVVFKKTEILPHILWSFRGSHLPGWVVIIRIICFSELVGRGFLFTKPKMFASSEQAYELFH